MVADGVADSLARVASEGSPVGSVARAIAALEVLAERPAGVGVNELGRRLGVSASSASRLLATLEQGGLVERDAVGPYRLGLGLVRLAHAALERIDVRALARPLLAELARTTGETATLSLPGGGAPGEAVTVDFVRSPASVASSAVLGRPTVPHATATGKVALAFGSGELPAGPLAALTPRTITDPAALRRAVDEARRRGWAEALGEREPDLHAVAAAVLGPGGELAGVLAVQGPAARLTAARRREVRAALLDAAAELGRRLGA
jgi:IclR family acetate operon transcriptional repressor